MVHRIALAVSVASLAPAAGARVHRCRPTVKYECAEQRCVRVTEGFQHAESFAWDDRTGKLSACLWSRCYQGSARPRRDASGALSLAASLASEPAGLQPLQLSLTIGADGKFTAVWEHRSDGLVFDIGRCDDPAHAPTHAPVPPPKPAAPQKAK